VGHIQKKGAARYQARWIDPTGHEKSKIFSKKSDAEKHLTAMEHSVLSGFYVDPALAKKKFGVLAEQWLANKIALKPSTRARYVSALEVHIHPRWRDLPLGKIEHAAIQAWLAHLVADGQSSASVHKTFNVFSGILDLAVKTKLLPANPANGAELPRIVQKPRRYLTVSQVMELASAASQTPVEGAQTYGGAGFSQNGLIVLTLAFCGLRWGEVAAVRVKHLDLSRRRMEVAESVTEINGGRLIWGTTKTSKIRSVPVPEFLADMLVKHVETKSSDELLFTAARGGVLLNRSARRSWFDSAAARIGVPGLTPHELRHTAASLAVSAGANVKVVQRMLGHASARMTLDTYADLFDEDLDALGAKLDAMALAGTGTASL
jgi:integrase